MSTPEDPYPDHTLPGDLPPEDPGPTEVAAVVSHRPTTESVAEEMYERVEPLAYADEQLGWPLLHYCNALGAPSQVIHDLISEGPNGEPGWSALLDIDRCPDQFLRWLAQLVGEEIPPGVSFERQRARIRGLWNWQRGTPGAIKFAVGATLSGTRTVRLIERTDSPYHFTVLVRRDECPITSSEEIYHGAAHDADAINPYDAGVPTVTLEWLGAAARTGPSTRFGNFYEGTAPADRAQAVRTAGNGDLGVVWDVLFATPQRSLDNPDIYWAADVHVEAERTVAVTIAPSSGPPFTTEYEATGSWQRISTEADLPEGVTNGKVYVTLVDGIPGDVIDMERWWLGEPGDDPALVPDETLPRRAAELSKPAGLVMDFLATDWEIIDSLPEGPIDDLYGTIEDLDNQN